MTDHCPDCGRPFVIAHEGAIETHCLANRKDDFLGRVMCKDNTIARLRLELAAAKAQVEAAEWHVSDYDAGDSAALHELRAAVDDSLGWSDEKSQEAGDYVARVHEVGVQLAAAKAASELSTAEREVVEETLAWQAYDRARPLKDPSFTTAPFVKWMNAVDRLLALRAQEAEG